MTIADLRSIVDALHATIARRVVLSDDADKSILVEQHLILNVLQRYDDDLAGMDGTSAFEWLIKRMARIEAGMTALQATMLRQEGGAPIEMPGAAVNPFSDTRVATASTPTAAPAAFDPSALSPDVSVEFDQSLVHSGFYGVEGLEAGMCYRWLGPDPVATVYVPKINGPVRVAIRVEKAFADVPIAETKVAVDDGEWTRVELAPWQNGFLLTVEPPPGRPSRATTTRIDIDCIKTVSPLERGSTDIRRLGLAIRGIDVFRTTKTSA